MYDISLSNNTLYIRPHHKAHNECKFLKVDYLGDYGEVIMIEESIYDELKDLDKVVNGEQSVENYCENKKIIDKYSLDQFSHLPKGL